MGAAGRVERRGAARPKHSLARQLVGWFLLLTLVPLGLLTFAASWNARALLTREATNGLIAIAERQSRQLEATIDERLKTVAALARTPSIGQALESAAPIGEADEAGRALRAFLTHFQDVSGWDDVLLASVDGRVVFSTAGSPALGTSLKTGPFAKTGLASLFERVLMTMGTDVSDLAYDASAGRPASYVATPVLLDGVVAGVVALRMRNEEMNRIVNDFAGLGKTGETVIAAREAGEALLLAPTRHDPNAAFRRRVPLAAVEGASAELVRGRIRSGKAVDYRGQKVLAVWSSVPYFRWSMMVKIDEAEAFAPVARFRLLSTLVEVPLFALVIAAALSVARSISGPIVRLTASTRAFAAGDLAHRATLETHNEMRVLGASFNQMGAKLQSTIAELERYGRTLESRVRDRTKELEDKNTALEEALASLKRAQEQILLQEKMASLGALTAGIAHEIKNPLNFVNNFSLLSGELLKELEESLAKEKAKLDPAVWEDVQAVLADLSQNSAKVREHGMRADSIVRSMLLHARAKGGEREAVDVNALVTEAVNLAYHSARGQDSAFNVKIESDLDPAAGTVDGVKQDLSRVFLNILGNACYALGEKRKKEGGSFTPLLSVKTKSLGDAVEVRIRDNGPGIPQAVLEKVFTPFFTTKPAGSGTGLGLSISYDIVTKGHGGTLEVETEEGRSAEFILKLPRARE